MGKMKFADDLSKIELVREIGGAGARGFMFYV